MAKRLLAGLAVIILAGLILLFLKRRPLLPPPANNATSSTQQEAATTADEKTPARLSNKNEAAPGAPKQAVPVEELDNALEEATANARIPEGIQSSEIPEDNGLHWFLLAAELIALEPYPDSIFDILEHGWRDDPEVIEVLQKYQPAFDAIRKGIEVGHVAYPPFGPDEQLPYLAKWRALARLMTAEAMMKNHHGDPNGALDELADVMAFGAESSRGGGIIWRLVGCAMQSTGAKPFCEMLKSSAVSAETCRNLAARIQQIDVQTPSMAEAVLTEIECFEHYLAEQNASDEELHALLTLQTSEFKSLPPTRCRQMFQESLKSMRQATPLLEAPFYQFDKTALDGLIGDNPISRHLMDVYARLPIGETRAKAERAGITVAAAVEAYRRENGAYPDSLDAIVPSVLAELPRDPFTGRPFTYARQRNSYKLYSANTNMRDDGGRAQPWNPKADDYVFLQPD